MRNSRRVSASSTVKRGATASTDAPASVPATSDYCSIPPVSKLPGCCEPRRRCLAYLSVHAVCNWPLLKNASGRACSSVQ